MRRALTTWSVILGMVAVAFGATVFALNSSLYSAHGFVAGYLDALARHDAAGALELAGVELTDEDVDDMLRPELMSDLTGIRLVSDEEGVGETRVVTFAFTVGEREGQSAFVVERDGATLGLFSSWRFAETPLSTVALTVLHDPRFDANDESYVSPVEPNVAAEYLVFTPGVYVFDHDSEFLTAEKVRKTITEIGGTTQVVVDVQANEQFVTEVHDELSAYFDEECVPQQVLLPTACPFGQPMGDRIVSAPVWSMVEYPEVTIVPGREPGTWFMPESRGVAHLVVDVQSLFDGSISTFDEDVSFAVSYLITLLPDGEILIQAEG